MKHEAPRSITVPLGTDSEEIEKNLLHISRILGYKINKTKLIKHLLLKCISKHSLYTLGFISFQELNTTSEIIKNGRPIKLRARKIRGRL